jgi:hypothetical protein
MNSSGWIQLIFYVAILLAITKPLGVFLCKVLDADGKDVPRSGDQAARKAHLQADRRGPEEGAGLEAIQHLRCWSSAW